MRIDTANLTPTGHKAIVECLRIASRRGRELREHRERAAHKMAVPKNSAEASDTDIAENAAGTDTVDPWSCTDGT